MTGATNDDMGLSPDSPTMVGPSDYNAKTNTDVESNDNDKWAVLRLGGCSVGMGMDTDNNNNNLAMPGLVMQWFTSSTNDRK